MAQDQESLPKEAIIVIVIVSAGLAVLIAWAIYAMWHGRNGDEVAQGDANKQATYRKEVRARNQEEMAVINGFKYPVYRVDEV